MKDPVKTLNLSSLVSAPAKNQTIAVPAELAVLFSELGVLTNIFGLKNTKDN
jgi:hypothetical protein